ncbi:MAG: PIN domain-containing protein [Acidobacteria bacterium]|nr:PIN domain-containing protein [Acidobacteriota bacterium]MBV9071470.1 PIN domain-containing protein [Acidobacteriota bacterium]MBV9185868.1 PIN domain-containing protein [Acidobacteriota bacterium]
MSLQYLLDTNVVSEPLQMKPRRGVLRKLRLYNGEVAIASVTWHELQFGMRRLPPSFRRTQVQSYIDQVVAMSMPVLDYDAAAAEWHAAERARLTTKGLTPPFPDGQIAAIAFVNDLKLVTFNDADFKRFEGLEVISWR